MLCFGDVKDKVYPQGFGCELSTTVNEAIVKN